MLSFTLRFPSISEYGIQCGHVAEPVLALHTIKHSDADVFYGQYSLHTQHDLRQILQYPEAT